jgi:hypothetical protein
MRTLMDSRLQQKHGIAGAAMMLHCVLACGEELQSAAEATQSVDPPPGRLGLRAPDIRTIFTQQQIAETLAVASDRNIEEIEVEGPRTRPPPATPEVWPTIFAPFWALLHPTQAWRILAPIPPDRAPSGPPPDATHPDREPATGIPRMAGE